MDRIPETTLHKIAIGHSCGDRVDSRPQFPNLALSVFHQHENVVGKLRNLCIAVINLRLQIRVVTPFCFACFEYHLWDFSLADEAIDPTLEFGLFKTIAITTCPEHVSQNEIICLETPIRIHLGLFSLKKPTHLYSTRSETLAQVRGVTLSPVLTA